MTEEQQGNETHRLVQGMFKKLDRIEARVELTASQNAEYYRLLSVLQTKMDSNAEKLRRLESENASQTMTCTTHRLQCPAEEFKGLRQRMWALVLLVCAQVVALFFSLFRSGGN